MDVGDDDASFAAYLFLTQAMLALTICFTILGGQFCWLHSYESSQRKIFSKTNCKSNHNSLTLIRWWGEGCVAKASTFLLFNTYVSGLEAAKTILLTNIWSICSIRQIHFGFNRLFFLHSPNFRPLWWFLATNFWIFLFSS